MSQYEIILIQIGQLNIALKILDKFEKNNPYIIRGKKVALIHEAYP